MIKSIITRSARRVSSTRRALIVLCGCAALLSCVTLGSVQEAWGAEEPQLVFTPFHADGIYALGETVGWTVTPAPGTVPPKGRFSYTIKSNDLDVVKTGSFDLRSGTATV